MTTCPTPKSTFWTPGASPWRTTPRSSRNTSPVSPPGCGPALEEIHAGPQRRGLLLAEHLLGSGYPSAGQIVRSARW
ncbi:hypothetical protein [Frankia canadensis]|uniref:hypothetical protein n=1 Tax=Frankia canadensis TaxID=1836972 RepID=UPI001403CF7C|nr:hypothetical protein [Frankia canadensis]